MTYGDCISLYVNIFHADNVYNLSPAVFPDGLTTQLTHKNWITLEQTHYPKLGCSLEKYMLAKPVF